MVYDINQSSYIVVLELKSILHIELQYAKIILQTIYDLIQHELSNLGLVNYIGTMKYAAKYLHIRIAMSVPFRKGMLATKSMVTDEDSSAS